MSALVLVLAVLVFIGWGMTLLVWKRVAVRRCECSEEIARIENHVEHKPIGFIR